MGELLQGWGVGNADLQTGLGGVRGTPAEVFVFHDLLSSYPPHGVNGLEHNLNFVYKNTGLFCGVLLNCQFKVQSLA